MTRFPLHFSLLVTCLWLMLTPVSHGQTHWYDDSTVYPQWEEDAGYGADLYVNRDIHSASAELYTVNYTQNFWMILDPDGDSDAWMDLESAGDTYSWRLNAYADLILRSGVAGAGGYTIIKDGDTTVWYGDDQRVFTFLDGLPRLEFSTWASTLYDQLSISPMTAEPPIVSGANTYDAQGIGYLNEHFNADYLRGMSPAALVEEVTRSITPLPTATPQPTPWLQAGPSGHVSITYATPAIIIDATGFVGDTFRQQIGNASDTVFVINHNLGQFDPGIRAYNTTNDIVDLEYRYLTLNSLRVSSNVVLSASAITVVVDKSGGGSGGASTFPTIYPIATPPLVLQNAGPNTIVGWIQTPVPTNTPTPTVPAIQSEIGDDEIQDPSYPVYHYAGSAAYAVIRGATTGTEIDTQLDFVSSDRVDVVSNAPFRTGEMEAAVVAADYSAVIGNVTDTTYTVTHNLNGYVLAQLHRTVYPRTNLDAEIKVLSVNQILVTFSTPPGEVQINVLKADGTQLLGNGSSNSFLVTTNANRPYALQVYNSGGDLVSTEVTYSSEDAGVVTFNIIPTTNQFRAVWRGMTENNAGTASNSNLFVRLDGSNRLSMTGLHGNRQISIIAKQFAGDVADAGYGISKSKNGYRDVFAAWTPTPTPTPSQTPTNTPTPTSTITPTPTATWTPIPNWYVNASGTELQMVGGVVTGAHVIETDVLRFIPNTTSTAAELLNELQEGDVVLWKPNGQEISIVVKYGGDLRIQDLIAYADYDPSKRYLCAIESEGQMYLLEVHYP